MKNLVRLAVSVGLSVVFLYFALGGLDTHALLATMRGIHVGYAAAYVAALVFTQVTRAMRWAVLVRPFCQVSLRAIWRISNVGNMLIMLLPLRLGEFARPYLLKKESGASLTAGMGAAVVERVLDGLLVTLMFFVSTYALDETHVISPTLRYGAFAALGLFSGAFVVIAATLLTHNLVPKVLRAVGQNVAPSLVERAIALLDAFVQGLRSLPDVKAAASVVMWTLLYWSTNALGMYALMRAFAWDVPVVAGFTVVCVLVIGIMIPAGPGFLGIYQAAIITGLAVYAIPKADAAAYSLVAWFLNVAVVCAFGLPYFIGRGHLAMADVVRVDGSTS